MPAASPSAASPSAGAPAPLTPPGPQPAAAAAPAGGRLAGVVSMVGSGVSNQTGAAIGSLAFPVLGPAGVVAVRQYVAALVLLAVGRPRLRSFTRREWTPVLLLALVFGTMNLSLYTAIDRIGLGLAVTLEFLGPLTLALAAARRRVDACCAMAAAAGAVTLMRPQPSTDYVGMGLGLLAAACWASYILLNRTVGRRLPGAEGSAAAALVSALVFLPVGVVLAVRTPPTLPALGCAVTAGVLSSAVPYLADLFTLRRVPAAAFGLFMSVNPVLAALVGWIGLGQRLGLLDWAAVAAVVLANALSILAPSGRAPERPPVRRTRRARRRAA
ncbi:EamA family transporter [Streptomyces longwoodensis]|uniref:EamA family transporter n=1 Tax=Streptomyces longwoodensis TaxID=68231 RepID=UPI00386A7E2E